MAAKLTDKQREKIEEGGWIYASMVVEVQGNEKEHVKKALETHIDKVRKEPGVEIISSKPSEPTEFKSGFYSASADLSVLVKDFNIMTRVALLYSPSSIEIFAPKEVKVPIGDAQNILNDISNIVTTLAHTVFVQEGQLRKYRPSEAKNPQNTEKSEKPAQ